MAVTLISDKEAIYETDNYDVVLVGVSTHNTLMGNFQGKIGVKYPKVKEAYYSTSYGDLRKLGKRLTIEDLGEGKPIISLMFVCTYPSRKKYFIDYDALERCLRTANAEFKGKKVLTTIVGSTKFDGKGDREKCLELLNDCCTDIDLFVYDYKQISVKEEILRQRKYFKKIKDNYRDNREMLDKISEMAMEMRKKTYLPTDMYFIKKPKEEDELLNY